MESDRQPDVSSKITVKDKVCKYRTKWLTYFHCIYETTSGKEGVWEMVGRDFTDAKSDTYNIQKNYGGCDVIAIAKRPIEGTDPVQYEKILLIEKIFRIP